MDANQEPQANGHAIHAEVFKDRGFGYILPENLTHVGYIFLYHVNSGQDLMAHLNELYQQRTGVQVMDAAHVLLNLDNVWLGKSPSFDTNTGAGALQFNVTPWPYVKQNLRRIRLVGEVDDDSSDEDV